MTSHWLLVIKAERVMDPGSEQPYSTQPSARGYYTAVPICVILPIPHVLSFLCSKDTVVNLS